MELNDPLIESVLIHLYLHPGGTNIAELVGEYQLDDVLECLVRNGMIKVSEWSRLGGFLPLRFSDVQSKSS